MIDIIKASLEFLGKRTWLIIFFIVFLPLFLFSFTFFHPLYIKVSSCVQHDNTFNSHNITYKVKSVVEKTGSASVNLCITEITKSVIKEGI